MGGFFERRFQRAARAIGVRDMLSALSANGASVSYRFVFSPEVAALSMSAVTLLVAINVLMLRRTKLAGIRRHPAPGLTPAVTTS
jgi:hypothetical protein